MVEKKSLGDIGMMYDASRTAIYKKLKSYMFIYDHKDSVKLFNILYKNTENGLFLERKYKRFLEGMERP